MYTVHNNICVLPLANLYEIVNSYVAAECFKFFKEFNFALKIGR